MKRSCKLTIFEGVDGSGKTTAAKTFAKETGARYVHFGPMKGVHASLGRMYVEAMLPALLGYQDVVFDRSWLSEMPYGHAYRGGTLRLTKTENLMLERLAMRCGAVVVLCDPGWDNVAKSFKKRSDEEMLDDLDQLKTVHKLYRSQYCSLPKIKYSYWSEEDRFNLKCIDAIRMPLHLVDVASAGNLNAEICLVGESFGNHKDLDPFYQWPFGSLSANGCSHWITGKLFDAGIEEGQLLWVNSDQDLNFLYDLSSDTKVISLGGEATKKLYEMKIIASAVEHPQHWRRFKHSDVYPLINMIKELAT